MWEEVEALEKAAAKSGYIRGATLLTSEIRGLASVDTGFITQCDHQILCGVADTKGVYYDKTPACSFAPSFLVLQARLARVAAGAGSPTFIGAKVCVCWLFKYAFVGLLLRSIA